MYKPLHGGTEIGTEGGGGELPAAAQPGLETNREEHKVATEMRAGRDPRSGQGRMIRDVSRAVSILDRRRWRSASTAPEPPRKRGRAGAGLRRDQRRRRGQRPPLEERAPGPMVPAPPRKQVRAAARQGPAFYKSLEIAAASCGSEASPPREERPAAAPRARSIKTLRNISFMRSR